MLKCLERVAARVNELGAKIDEENGVDCIYIDAPHGYVWVSNDCTMILAQAKAMWETRPRWSEAAKFALEEMADGLRLATEEEQDEICHGHGCDCWIPDRAPVYDDETEFSRHLDAATA